MTDISSKMAPLLIAAVLGAVLARWAVPIPVQANSDSGKRYVAVTGPYQDGVSLLYVLDQQSQHLAVYEARGGAPNSREVVFVGARRIDLDFQLDSFNDESEYKYDDLAREFSKRGLLSDLPKLEEAKE